MKATELNAIIKEAKKVPDVAEAVDREVKVPDIDAPKEANCITVDGKLIEIKPTMIKYFRNNAASFYQVLDSMPLPVIYRMTDETSGIDGDTAVLTFIGAVLDDAKLAKNIYTKLDAGQLLRMVEIFKRLNGIDTREERAKNVEAAKAKKG